MTKETKYIWATWLVPASTNLAACFTEEETPYIHAFVTASDEDGEGFHMDAEGALFYARPSKAWSNAISPEGFVRFVLAIPALHYAKYKRPAFSPSAIGSEDAEDFGMDTLDAIEEAVTKLEEV